jgi:antitoxin FitA
MRIRGMAARFRDETGWFLVGQETVAVRNTRRQDTVPSFGGRSPPGEAGALRLNVRCQIDSIETDVENARMANLTVRDVDEDVAQALKLRAAAHGRSAEAEHRLILREVLAPREHEVEAFAAAAARLRARLRHDGDSADIIREARDARQA